MVGDAARGQPLHGRPGFLWWFYLALSITLFGIGFASMVMEDFFASLGGALFGWAQSSADAVCIAGLYAYVRSIPLFEPGFWKVMLFLLLAKVLVAMNVYAINLMVFPFDASFERYVAVVGFVSPLLSIPMLVALWTYAFWSPHVWSDGVARRAVVRAS